jgi:hypothetical protein
MRLHVAKLYNMKRLIHFNYVETLQSLYLSQAQCERDVTQNVSHVVSRNTC